jgi:tetratricopeptide (TPR) repeat protein
MNLGKYKESSTYLWKVYAINPDHSEIKQYVSIMRLKMSECLDKANENIIKSKTEMGLLWTTKALVMYPNHPEALLLRSAIYRKLGKFNESLQDLNLASANMLIDDNSENVLKQISLTYNELGVYLLKKNNLIEANRFLDEAIKFKSNDLVSHYNKGECLLQMKEINKALEQFMTCLHIDPKNQEAKSKCAVIYYKFGIISFNNKDYEDCISNLERAMSYYPLASEFWVLRARTFLKMNLISKAYEDVNKALKLNPYNKQALELKRYQI